MDNSEGVDFPRKLQIAFQAFQGLLNPEKTLTYLKLVGDAIGSLLPSTSGKKASLLMLLHPLGPCLPPALLPSPPSLKSWAWIIRFPGDLSPFCWLLAVTLQTCSFPCHLPWGLSQCSPPTESSESWLFKPEGVNHSMCSPWDVLGDSWGRRLCACPCPSLSIALSCFLHLAPRVLIPQSFSRVTR